MSKNHRALLFAALLVLPLACKSEASGSEAPEKSVACTCGDPSTDIEGCAHALCVAGQANPDNPNCVCGTMSLPK